MSFNFRLQIYRAIQNQIIQPWVLPRLVSQARWQKFDLNEIPNLPRKKTRVWFHASSVGELESLWTLIAECHQRSIEIIVTVFSESARSQLERLRKLYSKAEGPLFYGGYSPWEGQWGAWLKKLQPQMLITAKYEAWPELWCSLQQERIPLIIIGARKRLSLKVAKRTLKLLGVPEPEMKLFPVSQEDAEELLQLFPKARIQVLPDPRWDRVHQRSTQGHERAQTLIQLFASFPRPWGVLGNIWPSDLEIWSRMLTQIHGTLWLVPHQVDPESLSQIETQLRCSHVLWQRTSHLSGAQAQLGQESRLLVDETGFLSELYSVADWAYAGGGFGKALHSIVEPAVHGIPIAGGARHADSLPEVRELLATGQLTLLKNQRHLSQWVTTLESLDPALLIQWKKQARARLGSTQQLLSLLGLSC